MPNTSPWSAPPELPKMEKKEKTPRVEIVVSDKDYERVKAHMAKVVRQVEAVAGCDMQQLLQTFLNTVSQSSEVPEGYAQATAYFDPPQMREAPLTQVYMSINDETLLYDEVAHLMMAIILAVMEVGELHEHV